AHPRGLAVRSNTGARSGVVSVGAARAAPTRRRARLASPAARAVGFGANPFDHCQKERRCRTMIDPARMDDVCRRGGDVATVVAAWRRLDERRKELQGRLDQLRAERNSANERMSRLDKKSPEFVAARDELKAKGGQIKE